MSGLVNEAEAAVKLPAISGWDQVARLFRHEKRLLFRFFATAVGRAAGLDAGDPAHPALPLRRDRRRRALGARRAPGGGERAEATLLGLGAVLLLVPGRRQPLQLRATTSPSSTSARSSSSGCSSA